MALTTEEPICESVPCSKTHITNAHAKQQAQGIKASTGTNAKKNGALAYTITTDVITSAVFATNETPP